MGLATIAWSDVAGPTGIAKRLRLDDPQQDDLLEWVNGIALNASLLGGEDSQRLRMARLYLAAHVAVTNTLQGTRGIVVAERVDQISRNYAAPFRGELYMTTGYGRSFLAVIRGSAARAGLVTGSVRGAGGRGGWC